MFERALRRRELGDGETGLDDPPQPCGRGILGLEARDRGAPVESERPELDAQGTGDPLRVGTGLRRVRSGETDAPPAPNCSRFTKTQL